MSDILQNDKMQETEERRTVSEIAAQMETEEELTGENNPMNRMENGYQKSNHQGIGTVWRSFCAESDFYIVLYSCYYNRSFCNSLVYHD